MNPIVKVGVISFFRSNSERATPFFLPIEGVEMVHLEWGTSEEQLEELQGYIILGMSSEKVDKRAIFFAAHSPFMKCLIQQSEHGKPILAIGDASHLLVGSGLIPGVENNKVCMAIAKVPPQNDQVKFIRLSNDYQRNAFTRLLSPNILLPISVGRHYDHFVMTPALREVADMHGLNLFYYSDGAGINDGAYIAAVSNKIGNVMAMLPMMEQSLQLSFLNQSIRDYILAKKTLVPSPLDYYPRTPCILNYHAAVEAKEVLLEPKLPDDDALFVEEALASLDMHVQVKRYLHWEIVGEINASEKGKIEDVLFEEGQKQLTSSVLKTGRQHKQRQILLRAKDNEIGKQMLAKLHYPINVKNIIYSEIWQIIGLDDSELDVNKIINTQVLGASFLHDYYYY